MRRSTLAGFLLLGMLLLQVLNGLAATSIPLLQALSGVAAITAGALLFVDLRTSARVQVSVLFLMGASLMIHASLQGQPGSIIEAISRNTLLLTMILSVGFLRLLLDLEPEDTELPVGRKAFLDTLLGLGLFGSVINISAPIMICDRLAREKPIDLFTAQWVTRVFCCCSSWSPYFGGAALILTYVHGVQLTEVMLTGLPLLIIAIVMVYTLSILQHPERVERFIGYPVSLSKLWLPVSLTVSVITFRALWPGISILIAITVSALVLTALVLLVVRGPRQTLRILQRHTTTVLPRSGNELLLFLSAGVLATGLSAFVALSGFQLAMASFTWQMASALLGGMILAAAAGLHPVIQISALTPLLLPINPDPDLLAVTFLFSWALGTAASPLAGTHLILQGRYGVSAWKSAVQNWSFVVPMYAVATLLLAAHTQVFEH